MAAAADDTDENIQYGEGWTLSRISTGIVGTFGPPLYGTLHISYTSTYFTYKFNGTAVGAYFSIAQDSKLPPVFNCTVDGQDTERAPSSSSDRGTSCFAENLVDTTHELRVNVAGTPSNPVMFDYLEYRHSSNVTDADFTFSSADPAITVEGSGSVYPLLPGSSLNIAFNGYSIGLFGSFLKFHPHNPSMASYSVDGGDPVYFTISNPVSHEGEGIFNQPVLQTERYPPGAHDIKVTFMGNNNTTPFYLSSFVVQNSTSNPNFPVPIPAPSSSFNPINPMPTLSESSLSTPRQGIPIPIVAGSIGGVLAVALIMTVAFLYIQHRKGKQNAIVSYAKLEVRPYELGGSRIRERGRDTGRAQSKAYDASQSSAAESSPTTQSPRRILLVHQDSGEDILQPGNLEDILELPPTYDASSPRNGEEPTSVPSRSIPRRMKRG